MGLPGVSRTAIGVARIRAAESARADSLFVDPLAQSFVAAAGEAPAASADPSPQRQALAFHVVIRTRYFDDYLAEAAGAGLRQVVLLAAGLDARAFRLQWPDGTRLFELDLPELLEVKERVVHDLAASARCDRRVVPVDLRAGWETALSTAGWDPSRPTAWLAEGLLVYLDPTDAERVLAAVTSGSAEGSRLALERSGRTHDLHAADTAAATDLWKGGITGGADTWLREHGWSVHVDTLADVAASYGRPIGRETSSGFIMATRG